MLPDLSHLRRTSMPTGMDPDGDEPPQPQPPVQLNSLNEDVFEVMVINMLSRLDYDPIRVCHWLRSVMSGGGSESGWRLVSKGLMYDFHKQNEQKEYFWRVAFARCFGLPEIEEELDQPNQIRPGRPAINNTTGSWQEAFRRMCDGIASWSRIERWTLSWSNFLRWREDELDWALVTLVQIPVDLDLAYTTEMINVLVRKGASVARYTQRRQAANTVVRMVTEQLNIIGALQLLRQRVATNDIYLQPVPVRDQMERRYDGNYVARVTRTLVILYRGAHEMPGRELKATQTETLLTEMVAAGAGVDVPGIDGRTALALAAYFSNPRAVRFLLSKGADPNKTFQVMMADGTEDPTLYTPLSYLYSQTIHQFNDYDVENFGILLDANADPSVVQAMLNAGHPHNPFLDNMLIAYQGA